MFTNKYKVDLLEFDSPELSAVNCARVSFAKQTDKITEKDKRLLKYLKEHKHNSVFYQYFHYFDIRKMRHYEYSDLRVDIELQSPFGREMLERGVFCNSHYMKMNDFVYQECKPIIQEYIKDGILMPVSRSTVHSEENLLEDILYVFEKDGVINYIELSVYTITMRVSIPMFIKNQIIRHSSGMQFNEVSRRYTAENLKFFDFGGKYRKQSQDNKQGSVEDEYINDINPTLKEYRQKEYTKQVIKYYHEMIESGACREQVRANLPQTMYTDMIMTFNLNTLIKMIKERTQKDTQKETRDFAEQVKSVVLDKYPVLKEVF